MEAGSLSPRGLIYDDDDAVVVRVAEAMRRRGFGVAGVVTKVAEAVRAAIADRPDVIVLRLELIGPFGLGLLPVLHAASPGSAIVVLSSLSTLDLRALDAGAYALLGEGDAHGLERCLEQVACEAKLRSGAD